MSPSACLLDINLCVPWNTVGKKKKKRNGTVKNEALVSLSILSMKKVNLNICPELRMNPSATFMSFEKLGNISALFSNSWVIIEVTNEVGCITWEDAFSGCWYWRGKLDCPAAVAWAIQGHIFLLPAGSQGIWDVIPGELSFPATIDSTCCEPLCTSPRLAISSPWKVELKLFCPVPKCSDNAGSVATKILYVNDENSDVPTNICSHTNRHVNLFALSEGSLPSRVNSADDTDNTV